jgi:small subunit ribosomal protein S27Ae
LTEQSEEERKKENEAEPKKTEQSEEERKKENEAEPKKTEQTGIYRLYKITDDSLTRLRPTCERCGPGYFMADHGSRYSCGHCGFTRYKPTEKQASS